MHIYHTFKPFMDLQIFQSHGAYGIYVVKNKKKPAGAYRIELGSFISHL